MSPSISRRPLVRRLVPLSLLIIILLSAGVVWAGDVYLNRVKITGQSKIELTDVNVYIDKDGNVLIGSKRHNVSAPSGAHLYPGIWPFELPDAMQTTPTTRSDTPAVAKRVKKTYWLVTSEKSAGESHYSIEIKINGQWVATYKSGGNQLLKKVNEFLGPGQNVVSIQARKEAGFSADPRSAGEITVLIGEGESSDGRFVMKRTNLKYQRRAGEGDHFNDEFEFIAE